MVNLYIVDYNNRFTSNGLSTYVNQLYQLLSVNGHGIKLNHIWVNSAIDKDFKIDDIEGVTHFHLPSNIAAFTNRSAFDTKAAEWLATHMVDKENIVIHFNWINHCPFANLLKQKIRGFQYL